MVESGGERRGIFWGGGEEMMNPDVLILREEINVTSVELLESQQKMFGLCRKPGLHPNIY